MRNLYLLLILTLLKCNTPEIDEKKEQDRIDSFANIQDESNNIDSIWQYIAYFEAYFKDSKLLQLGGFYSKVDGDIYLITAKHNLYDQATNQRKKFDSIIFFGNFWHMDSATGEYRDAKVVYPNKIPTINLNSADVAIIKINDLSELNIVFTPLVQNEPIPIINQKMYISGWRGRPIPPITTTFLVDSPRDSTLFFLDSCGIFGQSGAPVLTYSKSLRKVIFAGVYVGRDSTITSPYYNKGIAVKPKIIFQLFSNKEK